MGGFDSLFGETKRAVTLCVGLAILQFGCQAPPVEPTPTPLAAATAQPSPSHSLSPSPAHTSVELDVLAIRRAYESPVEDEDNGFLGVSKLLQEQDSIFDLALETEEQRKSFDQTILPRLMESFGKPYFLPPRTLAGEEEPVDYRGLRHLVGLVIQRADQMWKEGERSRALLIGLQPLHLAHAMRSRPETASVNLFSGLYAESSLRLATGWLASPLSVQELAVLESHLQQTTPTYTHLEETVRVDFAKLLSAMETEEGREQLGIGTIETSTKERWVEQLKAIFGKATELYTPAGTEPESFNEQVLQAATQIQGLVIDYPEVSTMQKRSFALHKATQLGVALLGPAGPELRKLSSDEIVARHFQDSPEMVEILKELIKVEVGEDSIVVKGQKEPFELLAPGVEPVFFNYNAPN